MGCKFCKCKDTCGCGCHTYYVEKFHPTQIMPAVKGDRAVYRSEDGSVGVEQLKMWAVCLVREEAWHPLRRDRPVRVKTSRRITGFITSPEGMACVEESDSFEGYVGPDTTDEQLEDDYGVEQMKALRSALAAADAAVNAATGAGE
jgi:hypothetical protein